MSKNDEWGKDLFLVQTAAPEWVNATGLSWPHRDTLDAPMIKTLVQKFVLPRLVDQLKRPGSIVTVSFQMLLASRGHFRLNFAGLPRIARCGHTGTAAHPQM